MIRRPPGAMLIEVLAALTLLAGTVVTLLLTQSRSLEQLTAARRRATAAHLAGELLASWHLVDEDPRAADQGLFDPPHDRWSWRRTIQPVAVTGSVEMTQVALEISQAAEADTPRTVIVYTWLEMPDDDSAS